MPRETKAQKTSRYSLLCASYDGHRRELAKLAKIVEEEKKLLGAAIEDGDAGTWGDWVLAAGTPREIQDNEAIKAFYASHGEVLPTKTSKAPVVVAPKVGK